MNKIFLCLSLIVLSVSCISKKESEGIKKCFEDYKLGIVISSGEQVVPVLDSKTKKYYSDILDHIKFSKRGIVYKLNLVDRILILSSRNKLSKREIKDLDVNSFLKFAIDNRMIVRYDYLLDLDFVKVKEVKKKKAKAIIKVNGTNKKIAFSFSKELGKWKINIGPIIKLNYHVMVQKPKELGISEDEYTIKKVKEENDGSISEEIWEAPFSRFN